MSYHKKPAKKSANTPILPFIIMAVLFLILIISIYYRAITPHEQKLSLLTTQVTPTFTLTPTPMLNYSLYITQLKDLQESSLVATDSIDFNSPYANGSPLVFGGTEGPNPSQQDAWDKLQEIGVNVIRQDFYIEYSLPSNITLDEYKNNKDDVQNPDKWNQGFINRTKGIYGNAKKRNIKVMGILSYAPSWLTYSGNNHGVPKDWDVYEDIVKKMYTMYRDQLDYLEIWNEPTYRLFLDIKNSGLSREDAYIQIFKHAIKAIHEVDAEKADGKKILIGGFVAHSPTETSFLEKLLQDPDVTSNLDFISYHNYEQATEPSWDKYLQILQAYNKSSLPIYITEWNHDYAADHLDPYQYSDQALPYYAKKIITYLKMGVQLTAYFRTAQINLNKTKSGGHWGVYQWENNKADLLPQAKSWRLLSKSLELGKGPSKIIPANFDSNTIGFINQSGKYGLVIVNDDSQIKDFTITLKSLPLNFTKAYLYVANNTYDGSGIIQITQLAQETSGTTVTFSLPPLSVGGVTFDR